MDKFVVVDDPNDKFIVTEENYDRFAEHQQPHYKFAVTEDTQRAYAESQAPIHKFSVTETSPESKFNEARSPHNKFTVEDPPPVPVLIASQDGQPNTAQPHPRKSGWPLWKKLAVGGVVLAIILALAIGLGVGLSQKRGGSENGEGGEGDKDSTGSGGGQDDDDTTDKTPAKPGSPAAWIPSVDDSIQMVLMNPVRLNNDSDASPAVDVWDIDLFDNDPTTVSSLQDAGRHVLCYFSAGSWEDWREDKGYFNEEDMGKEIDGFPGERFVNVSSPRIRNVMKGRIDLAKKKGCDGIDPAFVDSYLSDTGFKLGEQDATDYVKFLSSEARTRGLAIGLRNGLDLVSELLDWVDFSINEECLRWEECAEYTPFIKANKAVFNIEYPVGAPNKVTKEVRESICSKKGSASQKELAKFSTILKTEDLDGWVMYCDGKSYTTETTE